MLWSNSRAALLAAGFMLCTSPAMAQNKATIDKLNERERAVLERMAEGRTNLGIAKQLSLSARTVQTHITSVFTKLGLDQTDSDNNRVLAVLTFLRSADLGA